MFGARQPDLPAAPRGFRWGCPWAWSAAAVLALLVALPRCDAKATAQSPASLTYTEDAHAAYQEAMEAYDAKEYDDARALFQEVRKLFAYSRFAHLAELRMADVDFELGKYSEAISGYRSFVRGHQGDPNVEYAQYRICKALYLDINDTILLPPQEERDQATTVDAYRELRDFRKQFPRSRYRRDANYMLEVVTQRLVRHELFVARYYLNKNNFKAAVARCDYALRQYPGSGLDPEAMVLKGETLLKMKKAQQARQVFQQVVEDHGGPFGRVAKRFLAMMDGRPDDGAAGSEPRALPDGGTSPDDS